MDKYTSIGAVEGTLEALSIHGKPTFTIYDAVSGRAVKCELPSQMKSRVIRALGFKVMVRGSIRRDAFGRPKEVREVEEFRRLGTKPMVPLESLVGVFAGMGDLNTREYLAGLRGGAPPSRTRRLAPLTRLTRL